MAEEHPNNTTENSGRGEPEQHHRGQRQRRTRTITRRAVAGAKSKQEQTEKILFPGVEGWVPQNFLHVLDIYLLPIPYSSSGLIVKLRGIGVLKNKENT